MNKKTNKFGKKADKLLKKEKRPLNISEFMDNHEDKIKGQGSVNTENRQTVKQKVRHELRLDFDLSEKIREFVYKNRTDKTKLITKVLNDFFAKQETNQKK